MAITANEVKHVASLAKLEFTDEAVRTIAAKGAKLHSGARGLRTILESMMLDIQYELPEKSSHVAKFTITKDVVDGSSKPEETPKAEKETI